MKEKFINLLTKIKKTRVFHNISEKWQDIHTIMLFFIFCFSLILWKLFSYTIFDYEFYNGLADKQQIGTFAVPVNRGIIYSSIERDGKNESSSYFATSINLYDLAIDPKEYMGKDKVGDKEKLGEFLIDIVYNEVCNNKVKSKCKDNLLKFLKVIDLEDFEHTPEYIKKAIGSRIIPRIMQTKVTSVLLSGEFSEEQINKVKALNVRGFYPRDKSIYVNPEEYVQTEENLAKLSAILGMTTEELSQTTRKRELRYVPIYNKISIDSSEKIKELIREEKDAIKKSILEPGKSIYRFFIMTENPSRYYPENDIASQIIGFIDNEGVGRYGLEGYFNNILKGNNGKIVARKDTKGRIIDTISLEKDDLIGEGVKIVTTIDRNVQKKVEEILESGVKKYQANKGTIVVTEPKTGKIIAMANYPTYDINNYSDVYELEKVTKSKYPNPSVDLLGYPVFVEDSLEGKKFIYDNKEIFLRLASIEELGNVALVKYKYKNGFGAGVYRNDAISSLYEPGSIMKGITVAIGLDTGEIDENGKYDDRGVVKIDQFEIKNESDKCLGYHTYTHALDYSCNVGMIRIFQRVGKALVSEYFESFGFGELTGIDLEGEVYAPLSPWEKWSMANLFTKSYGLGVAVTPLQMATAYNILANGGVYVKPKIVEKIIYPNGTEINYKTEEKRRVIKEETSRIITKMLHHGVEHGLAKRGGVDGYSVAGKTGTAQILYKGRYQSGPGWTNASYAGYGPVEDPKFVIIVKIERPRTNVYGAATSGELFNQVATYLFDYFGIPKSKK
ncbi:hypothetical protein DLH72_03810 [Candidatus Gracilibacteria bacterium]|nr:MAG: hypothetical protein DLH72_03810 [Candidatus Gracilibacteria bacterium]